MTLKLKLKLKYYFLFSNTIMVSLAKLPKLFEDGYIKSHYKFKCFCCNTTINKGDYITQCEETNGITLRYRKTENSFYTPNVGSRWVHKDCNPDGFWTIYSAIKYSEFINNCNDECNDEYNVLEEDYYYDICNEFDEYDSNDENLLYCYNHYNKKH